MPFLVSDTLEQRSAKIRGFLKSEPVIAILLAAADFERTLRRAIIDLSIKPSAIVRKKIGSKYGSIGKYPRAWEKFLSNELSTRLHKTLANYDEIKKALKLRNELVHGDHGTTGTKYAQKRVELLLAATAAVTDFANKQGKDLLKKIRPRTKPRKKKSGLLPEVGSNIEPHAQPGIDANSKNPPSRLT